MGDRISIQFQNRDEKSVVLFSHWDGMSFLNAAKKYVKELKQILKVDKEGNGMFSCGPTGRMEPQTIMVDFIRWYLNGKGTIDGNYYLGVSENDGDNSDNGHHIIKLKEEK